MPIYHDPPTAARAQTTRTAIYHLPGGPRIAPVIVGSPDGRGGVIVRCPWCGQDHHHSPMAGSREPHCAAPAWAAYYVAERMDEGLLGWGESRPMAVRP